VKNIAKGVMFAMVMAASFNVQAKNNEPKSVKTSEHSKSNKKDEEGKIRAIRLITKPDGSSSFEMGYVPTLKHMNTTTFWANNSVEDWEKDTHKAPRRQYVVTLKGRIKFKVTDGSTFILKPGTILLAEDTSGVGHSWETEDDDDTEWVRLYIPISEGADDYFTPNK